MQNYCLRLKTNVFDIAKEYFGIYILYNSRGNIIFWIFDKSQTLEEKHLFWKINFGLQEFSFDCRRRMCKRLWRGLNLKGGGAFSIQSSSLIWDWHGAGNLSPRVNHQSENASTIRFSFHNSNSHQRQGQTFIFWIIGVLQFSAKTSSQSSSTP